MTGLLDKYLNAIRWNLPRTAKADDVIAELRDVIASRIEDREESLDRALTPDEVSALLQDFGHPLVVAALYGTQQWLVGPDLFPFYLFALKVVLALSALIIAVSSVAGALVGGFGGLGSSLGSAFWTLLAHAGLVTLIFAVVERTGWLTDHLKTWKPESLPELPDLSLKPKSAWESVFEIAVGFSFTLWWAGLIDLPLPWMHDNKLVTTPAPIWADLWAPILALLIVRVAFNLVQWLRPRWTSVRAILSVGTAATALALAFMLYRAGHWVTLSSATIAADTVAQIDRTTNMNIRWAIVAVGAVWLFQCGQELWRLYVARR